MAMLYFYNNSIISENQVRNEQVESEKVREKVRERLESVRTENSNLSQKKNPICQKILTLRIAGG